HFEAGGWAETTVTIRFWLLSALFAVVGMAIFYSEWLSGASL
ncbi:MAG: phospho-N-acetylmuramoyl-pentapeptide-transferase, partial [Corynebacterium sp.]|nr:phospho-N-acetylmuramoyl-pentapeptide-transferase [Corynebacterium sp.]